MTTPLRIGVIGFGLRRSIAVEAHRPADDVLVTLVCDPLERARNEALEAFGHDCTVVDSLDAFFSHGGIDAVMVLTPDHTHSSIVARSLRAHIPIFCEKPLAINIEDADSMLALAKQERTKLYVGHNMRHMPVIRQMKALIDDGRIGRVRSIWCRHFVGSGGDFYFKDWHAERKYVNSLLLQKGAHDIDVIHWLAGSYTAQVQGMGDLMVYGDVTDVGDNTDKLLWDWYSKDNWPPTKQREMNPRLDVEDISLLTMRLRNGVLATYQQCHFTPDYWRNYTIIGDAGRIENIGDGAGDHINIWTSRYGDARTPDAVEVISRGTGGHAGADSSLVDEFIRFVLQGGKTDVSAVAAREAVASACFGAESIRSGGTTYCVTALEPGLTTYFDNGQPC